MFGRAPLIAIAIPLLAGIMLGEALGIPLKGAVALLAFSLLLYATAEILIRRSPHTAISLALIPTALMIAIVIAGGMAVEAWHRPTLIDESQLNGQVVAARIISIKDYNSSTAIKADVVNQHRTIEGLKVQLFLDHKDFTLTEGDVISFTARFSPIRNEGNPEEFDYRQFMLRQGITLEQTLSEGQYKLTDHYESLKTTSKHIQRRLVNAVINSSLSPNSKIIVTTAILGDASLLDQNTRDRFSKAGLAHLLAISGLHIGMLLLIIGWLLTPLNYLRLHWLRMLLTIAAVGWFVFITGASTSAVRASIMASFVMVAYIFHRQNSSLNALFAAAIIILVASPMAIYDIGFQLSFSAVLMIVIFYPKLREWLNALSGKDEPSYASVPIWKQIAAKAVAAIATVALANLGCAVISAFYFHTLPLLSVLSNLIVIPIMPLFVAMGAAYTVFASLGVEISWLGIGIDYISEYIITVASVAGNAPISHIGGVYISSVVAILYCLFLLSLIVLSAKHTFARLTITLATLAAIAITVAVERTTTPRSYLVVLADRYSTPILFFDHGTCRYRCDDARIPTQDLMRKHSTLMAKYRIQHILSDSNQTDLTVIGHKKIAIIANSKRKRLKSKNPVAVDYMIVTGRYYGTIAQLLGTVKPETIVISADVPEITAQSYKTECDSIGFPVHLMAIDGAIAIDNP